VKPAAPAVAEAKRYPIYPEVRRKYAPRKQHPAKLRKSLQPGTVLILLAGKFKGRRVVLLRALPSGLLVVSGPYKLNGVPLRRVNPAYVIATKTRVDISKVKLSDKIQDSFFKPAIAPKRVKAEDKKNKAEAAFFNKPGKVNRTHLTPEQVAIQKEVDAQLLSAIKAVPLLAAYLRRPFSLARGQRPHEMVF